MSRLLVKPSPRDADGRVLGITPEVAGWSYVGFAVHELDPGQSMTFCEAGRETCIVVLSGTISVLAGNESFDEVGGRSSVFDDRSPGAVYVPQDTATRITAGTVLLNGKPVGVVFIG